MEIIFTAEKDIEKVMDIINQSKDYFAKNNISQWQGEYPNKDTILKDITNKTSFICKLDGEIVATFVLLFDKDKHYDELKGKWLNNGKYGSIHRLAVHQDYKKRGICTEIFSYCEKICKDYNIKSIRIDTHKLNNIMANLIQKNEYTYCGIITNEYNLTRIAFEKLL